MANCLYHVRFNFNLDAVLILRAISHIREILQFNLQTCYKQYNNKNGDWEICV